MNASSSFLLSQLHGTIHFGGQWPQNAYLTKVTSTPNTPFAKNWHTYGIEWEADMIRW
jgi:beta-glucanase (GH16 family)